MTRPVLLTGGGDWERYTFAGACNEPMPNNWKNACRRKEGHGGLHHSWDPRTGTNKGRHPLPAIYRGRRVYMVDTWGREGSVREARMLSRGAYAAPIVGDRLMVAAIKARERPWGGGTDV